MSTIPLISSGPSRSVDLAALDSGARALLDEGKIDDVELLVMERVESAPDDLQFFLPILRALVRRKEAQRSEALLQLILDYLGKRDDAQTEFDLLLWILKFWPDCAPARTAFVKLLRRLYVNIPTFDQFVKAARLQEAVDPMANLQNLESWLRLGAGKLVYMPKKGIGRISDVNSALNSLRVTLDSPAKEVISLRFTEAARLLTLLERGHFMYDVAQKLPEVQKLAAENPGEILKRLFRTFGSPLPLADIKEHMARIISEASWATWWKKAKGDRRLTVGPGARPTCIWNDSAADADTALTAQFAAAPVRDKLKMARQHGQRAPALTQAMAAGLTEAAKLLTDSDHSLSLEIILTLEKTLGVADHDLSPVLEKILSGPDAATLTANVADRALRKLAITLLKAHRADWTQAYLDLLAVEEDSSLLSLVYDSLNVEQSAERLQGRVAEVLGNPEKAPHFYSWMCGEMPKRPELTQRADFRLLRGLLAAIANDRIKPVHADLKKLFNSGNVVDLAVKKLNAADAEEFLALLTRNSRLESYRKDELVGFVRQRFPDVGVVKKETFFVTGPALSAKREEYEKLVTSELPQNALEIKRAREYGDLRENFEYHAARARQEFLSSRAKTLHDELTLARALDSATVDPSKIDVGTRVKLRPVAGDEAPVVITILGPWDSDPSGNVLSYLAPAIAKLIGTRVGGQIEFNEKAHVVEEIAVWDR